MRVVVLAGLMSVACAGVGAPGAGAREKAGWRVNGDPADEARLHGAISDLWGGDPGPICFEGPPERAATLLRKAYAGDDTLISVDTAGGNVSVTTRSPFGDGTSKIALFTPCG